jgi:hypothetical protein
MDKIVNLKSQYGSNFYLNLILYFFTVSDDEKSIPSVSSESFQSVIMPILVLG